MNDENKTPRRRTLTPEQAKARLDALDRRFLQIHRGELVPSVTRRADRGNLAFSIDFELRDTTLEEPDT